MGTYDYRGGRRRIQNILNIGNPIATTLKSDTVTSNGFQTQITAVYVNLRDSAGLLHDADKVKTAKVMRCFTSEMMTILNDSAKKSMTKEIGIREDCVYAIYSTPDSLHIQEIVNRTFHANTYIKMLNKLLFRNGIIDHLRIGIGMDTGTELIIKGGPKGTGIQPAIWTGTTLTKAFSLSTLGSKNNIHPIVLSGSAYNMLSEVQKRYFLHNFSPKHDNIYHSKAMLGEVIAWLNKGMPE